MRALATTCLCLFATLAASACRKKPGAEPDEDPGTSFIGDDIVSSVAKIKADMTSGSLEDAVVLECTGIHVLDDPANAGKYQGVRTSAKYQPAIAELTKLCKHDLPLALLTTAVEKAEAAHKAKPGDTLLVECYGSASTGLKELKRYNAVDATATALVDRFNAACPDHPLK